MTKQEKIFNWIKTVYPEIAPKGEIHNNYNDCIVGISYNAGREPVIAYDINLIRQKLMTRDGMSYDEAQDWIDFNELGAYVGEKTPTFLEIPTDEDLTLN